MFYTVLFFTHCFRLSSNIHLLFLGKPKSVLILNTFQYLPLFVVDACEIPVHDGVVGAEVEGAEVGCHSPEKKKNAKVTH